METPKMGDANAFYAAFYLYWLLTIPHLRVYILAMGVLYGVYHLFAESIITAPQNYREARGSYIETRRNVLATKSEEKPLETVQDHRSDSQLGIVRYEDGGDDDADNHHGDYAESDLNQPRQPGQKLSWKEILDKITDLESRLNEVSKEERL